MARISWMHLWVLVAVVAGPVWAERGSLFPTAAAPSAAALLAPAVSAPSSVEAATPDGNGGGADSDPVVEAAAVSRSAPSLFAGTTGKSFFAPPPPRAVRTPPPGASPRLSGGSPVARLLSLIASAEAGSAGYDAVVWAARIRPPKPPTHMTLGEIYDWIEATPGQHHAIGRYQFIPSTLRRVARIKGIGPDVRFSPSVQDQLAMVLLEDAGLSAFQSGEMDRHVFMRNLARIWAGLPLANGKSYYQGYAGNAATISWAAFEGGMEEIWPVR